MTAKIGMTKRANDWEDIPENIREKFMQLYDGQGPWWFDDVVEVYNSIVAYSDKRDCRTCNGEGEYRQWVEGEMGVIICSRCKGTGKE